MKSNKNTILNKNEKWIEENFQDLADDKKQELQKRVNNKGWFVYNKILKYLTKQKN